MSQAESSGGFPRYYMAYKHTEEALGEFVAIAGYMEEDVQNFWVLSNMGKPNFGGTLLVDRPSFTNMLKKHGITRVIFHSKSSELIERVLTQDQPLTKTVHLVQHPALDDDEYAALFALSQRVAGVTSNQSLFLAITLNKLPIYSQFTGFQTSVNEELASFDHSGLLKELFSNDVDPIKKSTVCKSSLRSSFTMAKKHPRKKSY